MTRLGRVLVTLLVVIGAGTATAVAVPTTIWTDAHDGGGLRNDDGYCCLAAPGGGVVVGGESTEAVGGVDLLVRRLAAADGHQIWSYRYDGYDDKDVAITDMAWDSVGQLLVTGFIRGCVG